MEEDTDTMYDPSIIEEFAYKLYSRADSIVLSWTFCMGLLGAVMGGLFARAAVITTRDLNVVIFTVLAAAAIFGAIGCSVGRNRSLGINPGKSETVASLQSNII